MHRYTNAFGSETKMCVCDQLGTRSRRYSENIEAKNCYTNTECMVACVVGNIVRVEVPR